MTKAELLQRKAKIANDIRTILQEAGPDGMTSEIREKVDTMFAEERVLDGDIERVNQNEAQIRALVATQSEVSTGTNNDAQRRAFDQFVRTGTRTLNTTDDGAMIPSFVTTRIFETLQSTNFYRQYADVQKTSSTTVMPYVGDVEVTWEGETDSLAETEPTVSGVTLGAYKMSALTKISEEFLQDTAYNVESVLSQRFAKGFDKAEKAAFTIGSGTGACQGVVTAATSALTSNSGTALVAGEILALYHALSSEYRQNGVFLMNDATLLAIRGLKGTDVYPFWNLNPRQAIDNAQDYLLGRPVHIVSSMANIGLSAKPIAFADLTQMVIADRGVPTFKRLNELYQATGEIGFRAFKRVDSRFPNSAAAKVITCKAS